MFEQYIFYLFSAILVVSAVCVVSVRNPVHAALFLVLAFFFSAAIWLLLEAEFLAIVLVLVYVGAVMVLFLFVVMMLDINVAPLREGFVRYLLIGLAVAVLMFITMVVVLSTVYPQVIHLDAVTGSPVDYSNTRELGQILFTEYLYPFEIAGAILLVAIIAAISLTMQMPKNLKKQNPSDQVNVKRSDSVRIVKMDAEKGDA